MDLGDRTCEEGFAQRFSMEISFFQPCNKKKTERANILHWL
jgi:hypothetical protein